MRKTFLSIFFILAILFSSYSQTVLDTDGLNNLDNVYLFSLKEYCKTLDTSKSKIVYVRYEHFIGESWPKEIVGFEIKYLKNEDEYIEVIKQSKDRTTIVGISPFDFRHGEFSVTIVPFSATYENNQLWLGNGGGLTIYFSFNRKQKGLIFKKKKWYGI